MIYELTINGVTFILFNPSRLPSNYCFKIKYNFDRFLYIKSILFSKIYRQFIAHINTREAFYYLIYSTQYIMFEMSYGFSTLAMKFL